MATLKIDSTALISRKPKLSLKRATIDQPRAQPPNPAKAPAGQGTVLNGRDSFGSTKTEPPKDDAQKTATVKPAKPTKPKHQAAPIQIFHSNRPEIIIDGYRSLYWYSNHLGQHLTMVELHRLGFVATEICKQRGIETGLKRQTELYPCGSGSRLMAKTYPRDILAHVFTTEGTADNE